VEHRIKFVGYGAYILTKRGDLHGTLDFITGDAHVVVRGEHFEVPAGELFITTLPAHRDDLKHKGWPGRVRRAEKKINPDLRTDPRTARPWAARFRQIEPVLQKAEILGSQIKRRPYTEYLDELRETGIARVEIHGEALFRNRTLIAFNPVTLSAFVVLLSNSSFSVHLECPKSRPPRLLDAMKSPVAASVIATGAEFAAQMRWSA
jgi:hypothetical protein